MREKALTAKEFGKKLRKELAARPKPPPPKERKEAGVTAYKAFLRIESQVVYGMSVPDPKGYNKILSPQLPSAEIGREARAALSASWFITPDHPEWESLMRFPTKEEDKAFEDEDKARAGVKTRKALFNGAGYVSLRLQGGQFEIKPWRYRGNGHWEGGGLVPVILSETVSDAEFGAAILEAIKISRAA